MIALGIDLHEKSRTAVPLETATGELPGEFAVPTAKRGHVRPLPRTRSLSADRRFDLKDRRENEALHDIRRGRAAAGHERADAALPFKPSCQSPVDRRLHRIAITQMVSREPARAFVTRKRADCKSTREALRCLKRSQASIIRQLLCCAGERRVTTLDLQGPSAHPVAALAS